MRHDGIMTIEATDQGGPWYDGTPGERIAIRVSSADTHGIYAVVESIAAPGCATPLHLHRTEEEHFTIVTGHYRFQVDDKIFDLPAGTTLSVPKNAPHSWRNISDEPGRLIVVIRPGGFEQCIKTIRNSPVEKLEEIAASYGCYL